MPERFLLQVLRCLVTHGILKSAYGVAGGYYLARPAKQISLGDIIEAFDSPLDVTQAELKSLPPAVRVKVFKTLQAGRDSAAHRFQKLAVADLAQPSRKK